MDARGYPATVIPEQGARGGAALDYALHQHGRQYYQEATYFSLVGAILMFAAAFGCTFIPWEERAPIGLKVKYLIALIPLWGGICAIGFHFARIQFEQRITIDPGNETLSILKEGHSTVVAWRDILAIQICGSIREDLEMEFSTESEYQVNLVYRDATGIVMRRCLAAHMVKSSCTRLARQYVDRFGFNLVDDTST